jgi:hypothetical protein
MNANRRLEEFILKLSTKQNESGQFDKINKLKLNINLNDLQMSKGNSDNKNYNKSSISINNK